jgi:hypothetical protein
MAHSIAHNLFLKYKKQLIGELGSKGLYTDQINRIGRDAFGSHWGGAKPYDRVKLEPNKYYVINTSSSGHAGIHWMALRTTANNAYIWDSYNRNPNKLVPKLIKSLEAHDFQPEPVDNHPHDQKGQSTVCGHLSLSFLLVVRDLGIRRALHV